MRAAAPADAPTAYTGTDVDPRACAGRGAADAYYSADTATASGGSVTGIVLDCRGYNANGAADACYYDGGNIVAAFGIDASDPSSSSEWTRAASVELLAGGTRQGPAAPAAREDKGVLCMCEILSLVCYSFGEQCADSR